VRAARLAWAASLPAAGSAGPARAATLEQPAAGSAGSARAATLEQRRHAWHQTHGHLASPSHPTSSEKHRASPHRTTPVQARISRSAGSRPPALLLRRLLGAFCCRSSCCACKLRAARLQHLLLSWLKTIEGRNSSSRVVSSRLGVGKFILGVHTKQKNARHNTGERRFCVNARRECEMAHPSDSVPQHWLSSAYATAGAVCGTVSWLSAPRLRPRAANYGESGSQSAAEVGGRVVHQVENGGIGPIRLHSLLDRTETKTTAGQQCRPGLQPVE
jgi:hypothetical protein